ncbi:MAG: hypothetical protein ACRDWH_09915 [Acidimicrobiia bacterium]
MALSLRLGLVSVALMLLALPKPALAHGIGGRSDLPLPLGYFVAGAVTVLIVTMALVLLWPRPRLQQPFDPRPIRFPGWRWIVKAMRWLGTLGLLLVVLTGRLAWTTASAIQPRSWSAWSFGW